jgi:predicted nucleic acid-binding protein
MTDDAGAAEAIGDTGPVLHLQEIARLGALGILRRLTLPDLVAAELRSFGVDLERVAVPGLEFRVVPVADAEWRPLVEVVGAPTIHPADAQVLVLARARVPGVPVLTDDLALRRRLEAEGAVVVGSVGILVRAFHTGLLRREELDTAVDALFFESTLHLSRAFGAYVRRLLSDLP